jgi:hypothetical protein
VTSLLVVVLRVSPLSAPTQAVPAFFISLFLSVSSVGTLFFLAVWKFTPVHSWDLAKILRVSLRQGILLACGTTVMTVFQMLQILNWWVAILIYGVFVLIELALHS